MTALLSLLAEPNRLEIVRLVWRKEHCASEIARHFRTTFGAVSQHLGRLWRAGLLHRRRDGRQLFYRADRAKLGPLAPALEAMWAAQLGVLKSLAEAEQRRIAGSRRLKGAASAIRAKHNNGDLA